MWLCGPKGDSLMCAGLGAGTLPSIIGATAGNVPGLNRLVPNFPPGQKPLTVTLSVVGGVDVPIQATALRDWQGFQGGSASYSQFASESAVLVEPRTDRPGQEH